MKHTLVNLPTADHIVVVDENGVEKRADAEGKWELCLSADGKTLRLGRRSGLSILVR